MNRKCITLFWILILFWGCQNRNDDIVKTNHDGEITFLPAHWKKSIHVGGERNYVGIIYGNLVFDDKIIITISDGPQKRDLTMIDVNDGSEIWKWNETYQPATESPNFDEYVVYQDILHWVVGSRHYAIDVMTGQTVWRDRKDVSFSGFVTMMKDSVLLTGPTVDTLPQGVSQAAYIRSIFDPDCQQFLLPHFRFDTMGIGNLMTSIFRVFPLSGDLEGHQLVITSQPYDNWYYAPELNLYNMKTKSWVYHSKELVTPKQNNAGNTSVIYEDKLYFSAGREIMCHDIVTGYRIWKNQYPADFLFSGFVIADGVLVANCENQVLYGIDPQSGHTIWHGRGSGISSPLKDRVLNGVVYFTGGGPNDVFAIDIHTGETLWALEAEEYEPSGKWKGDTYVIPGPHGQKGKVVACTYMHCYCFDAAR